MGATLRGRSISLRSASISESENIGRSDAERLDKFRYCVSQRARSAQDTEELLGLLERLESVDDVSSVMDVMRTRSPANL